VTLTVAITHAFPGFALDVAFEAPAGVTALFGRSGVGKTTIVNAVAGLLAPERGRIAIDGHVVFDRAAGVFVPPHRRRVGYVFQSGRLFPHLSVRANLTYGRWFGRSGGPAEVSRVVDLLGLAPLLERRPGHLSGGEAQRVAIGRALLSSPRVLLMDEPLSSLDEPRRAEILPFLERLAGETGIPILYVSHVMAEVARLATTVVILQDGRVARSGPAGEVLTDPAALPALGVREAGSVLGGRIVAHHADGLSEIAVSAGRLLLPRVRGAPGDALRIRIAAQDVILSLAAPVGLSALNVLPAVVESLHKGEGPGVAVALRAGRDVLLARVTRRSAEALRLAQGTPCHAVMKAVSVAPEDVGGRDPRGVSGRTTTSRDA
jgi:molybdate transport system ATP-binding protein